MRTLTGDIGAIVYHGKPWERRYGTKFRARRAVVLACVNAGWTFAECEQVLLEPASPVAALWQSSRSGRRVESPWKRLLRDYQAVSAFAADNPSWESATEVRQWLGELLSLAEDTPWPGRTGRTDKAVLMAAIAIATKAGVNTPGLSVRDLAMRSGITRKTAGKALRRLADLGWIEPVKGSGNPRHCRRYRLRVFQVTPYDSLGSGGHVGSSETPTDADPGHECWVRLGKAALDVWLVLSSYPALSAREAARRAQVSNSTAARQLPRLASYDLAARRGDGWIAGPETPAGVVKAMGWIAGNSKVAKRQAEYAEDREIYREFRRGKRDAARRADVLGAKRDQAIGDAVRNLQERKMAS